MAIKYNPPPRPVHRIKCPDCGGEAKRFPWFVYRRLNDGSKLDDSIKVPIFPETEIYCITEDRWLFR